MMAKIKYAMLMLGFTALLTLNIKTPAQGKIGVRYATLPGSLLWIDGTSNVDNFTCKTNKVNGYADIEKLSNTNSSSKDSDKVYVSVAVESLDCGKDLMNEDMFAAMKAGQFPIIKYELLDANLDSNPDSTGKWFTLDTRGNLYIAGEKNTVEIKMQVEKLANGIYRLTGSKLLSMLDFGIIPPSHFFGLIKAHDKLVVHFDLIAARQNFSGSPLHQNQYLAK